LITNKEVLKYGLEKEPKLRTKKNIEKFSFLTIFNDEVFYIDENNQYKTTNFIENSTTKEIGVFNKKVLNILHVDKNKKFIIFENELSYWENEQMNNKIEISEEIKDLLVYNNDNYVHVGNSIYKIIIKEEKLKISQRLLKVKESNEYFEKKAESINFEKKKVTKISQSNLTFEKNQINENLKSAKDKNSMIKLIESKLVSLSSNPKLISKIFEFNESDQIVLFSSILQNVMDIDEKSLIQIVNSTNDENIISNVILYPQYDELTLTKEMDELKEEKLNLIVRVIKTSETLGEAENIESALNWVRMIINCHFSELLYNETILEDLKCLKIYIDKKINTLRKEAEIKGCISAILRKYKMPQNKKFDYSVQVLDIRNISQKLDDHDYFYSDKY
jgi:hypothetical protein